VDILWALDNLTPRALLDIFLVALVFYGASFIIRGTQATTLLRGMLLALGGLLLVSGLFNLVALRWLLENLLLVLGIALPVIFQPELRRALEQLGRAVSFGRRQAPDDVRAKIVDEICQAAEKLSERRHGALIVLQKHSHLDEFIRTGIPLNSDVTSYLLLTIFWPKTELHDGAVVVDEHGRLAAAACVLPLTASRNLPDPKLGTRHRAALGISEIGDSICVVVSEESGRISIANGGRLIMRLDVKRLHVILTALYGSEARQSAVIFGGLFERLNRAVSSLRQQIWQRQDRA
jgi:diadenylate cyclase